MNITEIATPAYVIDEQKLLDNLKILSDIAKESGAKILLAQKAFSAYSTYPLIAEYLQGATASGLYEARLAYEEMIKPFEGKKKLENHVFEPAFKDEEFPLVCEVADHIVFNSIAQLEHHRNVWEKAAAKKLLSVGLRINPEFSTQEGHEIYDPCAPGSRLGIRKENLPNPLPSGVEGLHFHTLCEQGFEPLEATFKEVEQDFGEFFAQIKWINLGGGHHITKPDYDREGLKELIRYIKEKYNLEVYLEPGEAIALDAGYLVTEVMDIVETENYPALILDTSAACHMPDVLEMPYRPPLKDSGLCDEKKYTYRLSSRTCLAGDVIGDYSFDKEIKIGDRLIFEDMAIYSMVKNNTFNGMPLPDIDIMHKDGSVEVIKKFSYEDFKSRL
ncbi:MAG: carboxynorspermidine decarboxylase [Butyrivibrio hungatei]|nr:carboxynorspermidine decarboxylase [Butyrivibrio hungatei]